MIKVECEVPVRRVNDTEAEGQIVVESAPIWSDRVVLVVGMHRYEVSAKDLEAAVRNATNVARY